MVERDTPEGFATKLTDAGLAKEKARVYARIEGFSQTNKEVAEDLGRSKSTVSNQYKSAKKDVEEAEKLTHLSNRPRYVFKLPNGIGRIIDENIEHTVSFRLNRPKKLGSEFVLEDSEVIEAFHVSDGSYLLIHNYPERRTPRGGIQYFAIDEENIIRFINDWVIPGRYDELNQKSSETYTDQWFLTDTFEPEWLEDELNNRDIERVEVLIDDRFSNPLEENVMVHDSALSGVTHTGYQVAYSPTINEISELVEKGEIDKEKATEICRDF